MSDTIASDPYAGQAIHGSLAAAVARGHLLFIGETGGDPRVEDRLIGDFLDRQVDAFIYASMFTRHVRLPRQLRGQPVVLLNCLTRATRAGGVPPAVVPDELAAGRSAADALTAAGHRDGIHLVGELAPHVIAGRERLAGIRAGLAEAGTRMAGIIECAWWPEPAYEAVAQALTAGVRPRALICLNDRIAFGAYQALREAGLDIPGDVSIVSFDDSDLAAWLRPQLTSVSLPHYQLGWQAVELLLDLSDNAADPVTGPADAVAGSGGADAVAGSGGADAVAGPGAADAVAGSAAASQNGRRVVRVPMPLRCRASVGPPSR